MDIIWDLSTGGGGGGLENNFPPSEWVGTVGHRRSLACMIKMRCDKSFRGRCL